MKILLLMISIFIAGCAQTTNENGVAEGKSWDFDHQVQFDQHQISDNTFFVRVRSTSRTQFGTLATFLFRQAFTLCKSYGFKVEVLGGVESYNEEQYYKNLIPTSLEANVECPVVVSSTTEK